MGEKQSLSHSRKQLLLPLQRLCTFTAPGFAFCMQIKRLVTWWTVSVHFRDLDLLLGGSIQDFSKQTPDISTDFGSVEAYLSLILLLSNKVDYYWWWFSSCSWPTRILTYILISNKASGISRATMLWHRDVFKQPTLITRANRRSTLNFVTRKAAAMYKPGESFPRWSWLRHAGHNQQTETETSAPPCLELTLSLHCHGCCVGSADALRLCLCYRCCDNQSSGVWRTQPAWPRLPSCLQRSLWKCSVMAVAAAERSTAPLWHTISLTSFPLLSVSQTSPW